MTRIPRLLAAAVAALALLIGGLPQAAAAEEPAPSYVEGTDEAASLFDPLKVVSVNLNLPQTSIDALWADPRTYVPATFTLTTDSATYGPLQVGVHLKGQWGSFRQLNQKAGFKVKLAEFVPGQKILGLKKLTFNNMVQDPTAVREAMAYRLFRSVGVPAPRVGYADIRVNGERYGLYANIETLDSVSLKRWFGSTQHLYEGAYWTDAVPGNEFNFQADEGDAQNRQDLAVFSAANVNFEGEEWYQALKPFANWREITAMWAVEHYIGHWDGYSFGIYNNYYLHSDDSGRFSMLPWGTDQTWEHELPLTLNDSSSSMVRKCYAAASCWPQYVAGLMATRTSFLAGDYPDMAMRIAQAIDPYYLTDPRKEVDQWWIENRRANDIYLMQKRRWRTTEKDMAAPYLPTVSNFALKRDVLAGELTWDFKSLDVLEPWHEIQISKNQGASWSVPVRVYEPKFDLTFNNGELLNFRVRTVNLVGASAWSAPIAILIPKLPANPALSARHSKTQTLISWRQPGALGIQVLGYRVQVSKDGKKWSAARAVTGTSTAFNAPKGSTRYYRIQVVTDFGTTAWSRAWKFKKTV